MITFRGKGEVLVGIEKKHKISFRHYFLQNSLSIEQYVTLEERWKK